MMHALLAAEGGYQEFTLSGGEWAILIGSALTALLAIAVGFFLMRGVLAADQGTEKMKEIAAAIQEGAMAYLKRQFKTIAIILVNLVVFGFTMRVDAQQKATLEAAARQAITYYVEHPYLKPAPPIDAVAQRLLDDPKLGPKIRQGRAERVDAATG